jgi:hypothetical protein
MYEAKTKPTQVSFRSWLAGIEDEARRKDCKALATLMTRVTGHKPKLWGSSLVGFGQYHYRYPSGHEGDTCLVGFASGKSHISVYLIPGYEAVATKALLAQLGRHRTGKGCLYIRKLADVQLPILEELVLRSVAETKRRYPSRKA